MFSISKEQTITSQVFQFTVSSAAIIGVLFVGEIVGRNIAMWL